MPTVAQIAFYIYIYRTVLKPALDFSIAGIVLVVVSPLFLTMTVLLFINNKGNPFFIQKRPGKNGKIFNIIKFKTMNDKRAENQIRKGLHLPFGSNLSNDRCYRIAQVLQKTFP